MEIKIRRIPCCCSCKRMEETSRDADICRRTVGEARTQCRLPRQWRKRIRHWHGSTGVLPCNHSGWWFVRHMFHMDWLCSVVLCKSHTEVTSMVTALTASNVTTIGDTSVWIWCQHLASKYWILSTKLSGVVPHTVVRVHTQYLSVDLQCRNTQVYGRQCFIHYW